MKRNLNLCWYEFFWERPFNLNAVYELLIHLATTAPRGPVVFEVRGSRSHIRYLLGTLPCYSRQIHAVFRANGKVRFSGVDEEGRVPVAVARRLKISHPVLSLKTDITESVIRAGLAAMVNLPAGAEETIQILLGPSFAPRPTLKEIANPHTTWWDILMGNVQPASAESVASVRDKISQHGFFATVRLGLSEGANVGLFQNLISALRITQTAGIHISSVNEKPEALNTVRIPWHFPLRQSIKELANFLLLPVEDTEYIGVAGLHPRLLPPPGWYKSESRNFAVSATGTRLGIAPKDALEHTIILGPTGAGKSTAMLNLILADINAKRGVLVIDPKADLVNDILARIPSERDDDVVVLDPSDPNPVGFNPFAFKDYGNPNLIADAVTAVFKDVFSENWGIRSQDIFTAGLLTLAQTDGASLLWLPTLLTNEAFRRKVTSGIKDKIGLEPYWAGYEEMKDTQRATEIAPVLNKMRQFLCCGPALETCSVSPNRSLI